MDPAYVRLAGVVPGVKLVIVVVAMQPKIPVLMDMSAFLPLRGGRAMHRTMCAVRDSLATSVCLAA